MRRESLKAPTQSPHFQSRSGMFGHIGRTYSHSGMMDYPSVPITEWNFGKFLDPVALQSGMLWIKEVEIAKSIDEHVSSRSITGQPNFPEFDMLDAIIASALKKLLNSHVRFRKRASVEGQRAQKIRQMLTRKTDCVHDLRVFPCNRSS